jgi:TonB family protein
MAVKARPYDQFGPYILFKKLEADSLGDLWRAAKITGPNDLGPLLALRRLSGGHRTALQDLAPATGPIVAQLNGTTFVKGQTFDVVDGIPFLAFEYQGGRSLRHIVDRARGGTNAQPNPIPLDLAVLIADRIALSLATLADMKRGNERLLHGALIPQFVWITDDGEVRIAGQQLGRGINASLGDAKVNAEFGRYFSPEYHSAGTPAKLSEVYSLGALLFLLVTGLEPPDPLSVTAFSAHVRAAKTMTGQPIPLEIRQILDKSLVLDVTMRYPSITEMKQALDVVAAKHSSTTFNLAFYLSTLLKKEFEAEAQDREKESKVNVAAYTMEHAAPPAFASAAHAPAAEKKSRTPLIAAAAIAVIALAGGGAYIAMKPSKAAPAPVITQTVAAPAPAPVAKPPVQLVSQPIVATPAGAPVDPNAAKKAFEAAVNQQLQAEMLKLQSNFNKQLQQTKSKNAPVVTEAPPPVQVAAARPAPVEEAAPSAAALDERRLNARAEPQTQTVAAPAPVPAPVVAQPQPAAPAPVAAQSVVREGDIIQAEELDAAPKATRMPSVAYPAPALRMRIETSVIVTALISEDGNVIDVKVLRGDPRFGFNDSAMRAVRTMKFTPAMKDGKRVKTWFPQTINFKL